MSDIIGVMTITTFDTQVATKSDIHVLDRRLDGVQAQLTLIKWMLGLVVAVEVLPLLKAFL